MTATTTDTTKAKKNGAAPPKPSSKKPGRWHEHFPFKLTDAELASKGNVAAALDAEIESLEADKKSALASFKGRVDAKKSELRTTMRAMRTGEELRPVEVVEEFDFRTNTCKVVRSDTGTVLRTRALTLDERQEDLFNGKPAATNGAAKSNGAQQSFATVGDALAAKAAAKGKRPSGKRKPDDGPTDITDPSTLLAGAKPEDGPTGKRRPAKRRGR